MTRIQKYNSCSTNIKLNKLIGFTKKGDASQSSEIESVTEIKFLGAGFDEKLALISFCYYIQQRITTKQQQRSSELRLVFISYAEKY